MTTPTLLFALVVALFYGAVYHLVRDGGFWRLILYFSLSVLGFTLGHLIGIWRGWMFLTLNVMGFVTYRLLPAAPPWYFHLRGCDVDVLQRASTGPNLARVDAFLGTPYFASMYARSANVFGALPSLHVTYPLLIVLEGRPVLGPRMRIVSVAYFVSMCVAAVYLDHHWILDVLLGIVFAVIACTVVRAIFAAKPAPSLAVGSS